MRDVTAEGGVISKYIKGRARGRPRKTWDVLLRDDLRAKGLTRGLARDRAAWKAAIR